MLAEEIPPIATRLRRDFRTLTSFIATHAALHRATREIDQHGRIVATIDDYAAVRERLGSFFSEAADAMVSEEIRETVEAAVRVIERKRQEHGFIHAHVNYTEIGKELGRDKATANRRGRKAVKEGFLTNSAQKGKPAELVLGIPLPSDERDLLPTVERVEERRDEWLTV